jgi:thiamine biosynthesis protein ThiS
MGKYTSVYEVGICFEEEKAQFDYNWFKTGVSTNMPIEIVVNGQTRTIPAGETILGLLGQLRLDPARVAVEIDRRIVKQAHWDTTALEAGSQLEIVQFVGGG